MKSYVKPTLEVINMRTSENIADNFIKTIYTKTASSNGTYVQNTVAGSYSTDLDIVGSQNL